MKFKGISSIAIVSLLSLSGCNKIEPDSFDYLSLYQKEAKKYEEKVYDSISASYGYIDNETQGYNGWYYLFKNEQSMLINKMVYSSKDHSFIGDNSYIDNEVQYSSINSSSIRRYNITQNGNISVYGNIHCIENTGEYLIYLNNSLKHSVNFTEKDYLYYEINFEVKVGDYVDFVLKGEDVTILSNPTITYQNSQNSSLYHLTTFNRTYGDVFPFYDFDNHTLYNYFLYTEGSAMTGEYKFAIEKSNDFLTYENIPEANNSSVWRYVMENAHLAMLRNCNAYIDNSKYNYGVRDCALVFDDTKNRYLLIAGCYYEFSTNWHSDLVIYESNDDLGFDWNPVGNVIEKDYIGHLPECPSIMKINDRWYAFVSVSHITAHQVGPFQYWMGDKNEDIMDIDFSNKQFSFVDGEDLCAARIFKVGEKFYMFGWIPYTYDTMPWNPWGGYLNLPREVIQHKDGTLGGRMDPGLREKINFGNIQKVDSISLNNNKQLVNNSQTRNYISYSIDMNNSTKSSIVFEQKNKEYLVSIEKIQNNTMLKIESPNDDKHPLNSEILIPNKDKYDIYLTIDNGIIEAFVDDEYSLTGHTAMDENPYSISFSSNNNCSINNININKLIPYFNLH